MAKKCALGTGNLLQRGLPRKSEDRISDHPDMTLAVDRVRKAITKQTNQKLTIVKDIMSDSI